MCTSSFFTISKKCTIAPSILSDKKNNTTNDFFVKITKTNLADYSAKKNTATNQSGSHLSFWRKKMLSHWLFFPFSLLLFLLCKPRLPLKGFLISLMLWKKSSNMCLLFPYKMGPLFFWECQCLTETKGSHLLCKLVLPYYISHFT